MPFNYGELIKYQEYMGGPWMDGVYIRADKEWNRKTVSRSIAFR